MASAIVLEDTVTTQNDSKVRLVYDGTTVGTKDITVPEVTARMVTDNTTAYHNDTSTFIANTLASGAIIEIGSNANGSYTKYADGTLVCMQNTTNTSLAITNAEGSLFRSAQVDITFPFLFTTILGISFSMSGSMSMRHNITPTLSAVGVLFYYTTSVTTAMRYTYIAIGRWKS